MIHDFLYLNEQFSDEEKLIQKNLRRYVNEEVIPFISDAYEKAIFPKKLIEQVAGLGLLGMTLPEKYGGSGLGYVAYGLACQELERGDTGLRSFVSVQSSLCMYPIFEWGTEEQKQKFLPPMARASIIGCFGLTESDAGSDPSSMKTYAKKVKGGWILNGSKMWITNAPLADIAIVWASTEEGIRGFIVEKEFPGFERHEINHKMSLRASATGELVFQNCFIPDENFLPGTTKGLTAALNCLTHARYGIAWGVFGAAQFCFEQALQYTQSRHQFQKPVASFQLVQLDLVNMFTEIVKGQLLNLQVGRLKEKGQSDFNHISFIKRNACREALKIARLARHLLGANGISLEYHIIRHMNNLESVFTYEGTDNIHTLILGKFLTGISAFE